MMQEYHTVQKLGKVGCIGRFKPLHLGGERMLESLCESSDHVTIGIGSSNKYNVRNPFTAEETKGMIDAALSSKFSNYSVIFLPDFAHEPEHQDGQTWRRNVKEHFDGIDYFVSGNNYVKSLLHDDFKIIPSYEVIPVDKRIALNATIVRVEMARDGHWQDYVSPAVAKYITENKLDVRFRKEFGLETIAGLATRNYITPETEEQERHHIYER